MALDGLITDHDLADPVHGPLRTRAQDLAHAEDWPGLVALRRELEADRDLWTDFWGPLYAIAARRCDEPDATDVLRSLVDDGFRQPWLWDGGLAAAYGADPAWPELARRMAGPVDPNPLVLLDWPTITPAAPLALLALPPARAEALRAQLPEPAGTAWETVRRVLSWVSGRWRHAANHLDVDDAVTCLARVDAGERFACVEYALVLAQALNALDVPARRLWLRQRDYQYGIGRSHVVAEAWVGDGPGEGDGGPGGWVLLDGQNGLYWGDETGRPLGAAALVDRHASGAAPPRPVVVDGEPLGETSTAAWFSYFHSVSSTAGTWSEEPFGVLFQRFMTVSSARLERRPDALYPDLGELAVSTTVAGGRPAVRVETAHPYARGVVADGVPLADGLLLLDGTPGEHEHALAATTRYGPLPAHRLAYTVTAR